MRAKRASRDQIRYRAMYSSLHRHLGGAGCIWHPSQHGVRAGRLQAPYRPGKTWEFLLIDVDDLSRREPIEPCGRSAAVGPDVLRIDQVLNPQGGQLLRKGNRV